MLSGSKWTHTAIKRFKQKILNNKSGKRSTKPGIIFVFALFHWVFYGHFLINYFMMIFYTEISMSWFLFFFRLERGKSNDVILKAFSIKQRTVTWEYEMRCYYKSPNLWTFAHHSIGNIQTVKTNRLNLIFLALKTKAKNKNPRQSQTWDTTAQIGFSCSTYSVFLSHCQSDVVK